MSYLDRLRECKYTDPSGAIHTLLFDELSRSGEKKAGIFELPQQDNAEVQDLGMAGSRFSMSLYITGQDYDTASDSFFSGLSLKYTDDKPGLLSHPRWGDLTVKPLTFSQSESFVDGMGRALFSIEFIKVNSSAKFPTTSVNVATEIKAKSDSVAVTIIAFFLGPETARDIAIVADQAVKTYNSIKNKTIQLVAATDDLASALEAGVTQAIDSIGDAINDPTTLATTVTTLTRLADSSEGSISNKISAYLGLFTSLATESLSGTATNKSLLGITLSSSALAAAESATSGTLSNRAEAVAASDSIGELLAYYQTMMDSIVGYANSQMVAEVIDILTMAQNYLIESSFGLKSARRKILDHNSDPITQAFELYGTVDMVPQFISDNNLQDSEFFILPMGREIVWYA